MQKSRKRKQVEVTETRQDPYPTHSRPTAEECRGIRDELLALHGFPPEFVKYRNQRLKHNMTRDKNSVPLDMSEYDEGEEESVLDGLVKTLLSQNTTEANSLKAFASLKSTFPTWEHVSFPINLPFLFLLHWSETVNSVIIVLWCVWFKVLAAEQKCIENAIRCGGLAPTKAACIKNILKCLLESKGKLCLEYLRGLSIDEIKAELSRFRGIGPKTVFLFTIPFQF